MTRPVLSRAGEAAMVALGLLLVLVLVLGVAHVMTAAIIWGAR